MENDREYNAGLVVERDGTIRQLTAALAELRRTLEGIYVNAGASVLQRKYDPYVELTDIRDAAVAALKATEP